MCQMLISGLMPAVSAQHHCPSSAAAAAAVSGCAISSHMVVSFSLHIPQTLISCVQFSCAGSASQCSGTTRSTGLGCLVPVSDGPMFYFLHIIGSSHLCFCPLQEVHHNAVVRLEALGFDVGCRLTARLCQAKMLSGEPLEAVKFICKDFWTEVFRKQVREHQRCTQEVLPSLVLDTDTGQCNEGRGSR